MTSDVTCPHGRRVYIDLGVNWANTVHLFEEVETSGGAYEVYGFEASPLIQPYIENYFAWLNGDLLDEPESCLPPTGSTNDLNRYAPMYGCPASSDTDYPGLERMRQCMFARLAHALGALRPNPQLNSSLLIQKRLLEANRTTCLPHHGRNKYTFIPAAAAGSSTKWLSFYGPPHQLIRGGSFSDEIVGRAGPAALVRKAGDSLYNFRVRVVDVASWIARSFTLSDFVILKVDIEGAEFELLEQMVTEGTMPIVDVLSIECHPWVQGKDCGRLRTSIARAAPALKVLVEGKDHFGIDSRSGPRLRRQNATIRACDAIDLGRFALHHRAGKRSSRAGGGTFTGSAR